MGCDDVINQINEIRRMFQSTHPHGVRLVHQGFPGFFACFNPRTRTGCDCFRSCPQLCIGKFQSTHPHGVRLDRPTYLADAEKFQSTHPHGVRPVHSLVVCMILCFNPRTRTGCDPALLLLTKISDVSIHAPARGATPCKRVSNVLRRVSIHAPARGATYVTVVAFGIFGVSIHAPARGATPLSLTTYSDSHGFNPRTRTGCDTYLTNKPSAHMGFQSTHPHGVRHASVSNMTVRRGVSIHAPARGATPYTQQ